MKQLLLLIPVLSLFLLLSAGVCPPLDAAPIPTTLTVEITSVDAGITAIAVGDRFTFDFVVEDSTVDTNAGVGAGTFPGLMTSFTMTADPGNTGTWTPSGTFNLAGSNFVTNAFGDNMTFQVAGAGFPDGGAGVLFSDIDLGFGWPSGVNDNGIGDTFAQQLAPPTFGVPPAVLLGGSSIRFLDPTGLPTIVASFDVAALDGVAIPEMNTLGFVILVLSICFIAWIRLR